LLDNSDKIRILFFDHVPLLSGAELSLLDILVRLDRQRYEPVLVLTDRGPLSDAAENAGIPVRFIRISRSLLNRTRGALRSSPLGLGGDLFRLIGAVWALAVLIRREQATVVYTNTLKTHVIGGIAGRLCGARVIWHYRDVLWQQRPRRLMTWLGRFLPHGIIAISGAVAEQFDDSAVRKKVSIVYNGIDHARIQRLAALRPRDDATTEFNLPPNGRLVGIVGQLARWKGQDVFLRAAALVAGQAPDARFLVIGEALFDEDAYRRDLLDLAGTLGIRDRVIFTGQRGDVYGLMKTLDVLAHCSVEPEPFGRVIVEAMALGVPVAASDNGAVREIIEGSDQGIVYPAGDHRQLAAAVLSLLHDRGRAGAMAEQGRQRSLQFGIDRMVAGIETVLHSV
jgi:glycosyltransferase involved in cell wall biosynthesis